VQRDIAHCTRTYGAEKERRRLANLNAALAQGGVEMRGTALGPRTAQESASARDATARVLSQRLASVPPHWIADAVSEAGSEPWLSRR